MKNNVMIFANLLRSLLAFGVLLVLFQACNKNNDPEPPALDRAKLKARLDSATALHTGAAEGIEIGQYPAGSKAVYQTTIGGATTVHDDATAPQRSVDHAYDNLGIATATFKGVQVKAVNRTKLRARLDSATVLHAEAVEGTTMGQYLAGSKATYQTAIGGATTVHDEPTALQAAVNSAYESLGIATVTFSSGRVKENP